MSNIKKVDNKKINLDSNNLNLGSKNQSSGNNSVIKKINSNIPSTMESYELESLIEYYKPRKGIYDEDYIDIDGGFGGNQGVFYENYEQYIKDEKVRDIINKYYPNEELTEEDLQLLFSRMNHIGCGYVAGCNSIYNNAMKNMSYKEFQDKFGFLPYNITTNEEGKKIKSYNHKYMFLDFFLYYQKNYMNFKSIEEIYGNEKENPSHTDGALDNNNFRVVGADGTALNEISQVAKDYLNEKGIKLSDYGAHYSHNEKETKKLKKYGFSDETIYYNNVEPYKKALEDGKEIVISSFDFDMYEVVNKNGHIEATNKKLYEKVGPHGMSVVGVDEKNAKLIISTWGRRVAIDINDVMNYIIYDFDIYDFD